ncbi:hypothetical protein [Bremerella alba]|uniref:Uncharacterized protein n=1 Tax=Bremerella alba TaxID=980252 RepID=A0A7V8V373_9BACT|nr:hypothetical protein [Bremerella alba]MBA2113951.1 hypothetical protein [Bremerella alba]
MATDTSPSSKDELSTTPTPIPAWAKLTKGMAVGVDLKDWQSWKEYLQKRDTVPPLQSLVSGKKNSPLAWALFADESLDSRTLDLLETLGEIASGRTKPSTGTVRQLESWLNDLERRISERNLVLELLAVTHALPNLAVATSAELWWNLLDKIVSHANDAVATNFENKVFEQGLAGEVPLTLAYIFPELKACRQLGKPAARVLDDGMQALTDGEGLPKVDQLLHLRSLLACWTRSVILIKNTDGLLLSEDSFTQYQWLVRHAFRLTRADGTQTFSHGISSAYNRHLMQTALDQAQDEDDTEIAKLTLPKMKGKGNDLNLPYPSYESAYSQFAYLRCDWHRSSPRLAVRHDLEPLIVELESREEIVLSGTWDTTILIESVPIAPTGNWEQVGWQSDDDGDYLELEQEWTDGVKLQRLIFLAREDKFMWVMDTVLLDSPAEQIQYQSQPPIVSHAKLGTAAETNEVFVELPGSKVTLLPVGINEWQSESSLGKIGVVNEKLSLQQTSSGRGIVVPMFFDLSRKGQGKPLTWRQLTVAEKLVIQPRDQAVAYRVQTGTGHWAFYRSLTGKASRTFLGVNLIAEALVARFDKKGDIEKLLEVEAS